MVGHVYLVKFGVLARVIHLEIYELFQIGLIQRMELNRLLEAKKLERFVAFHDPLVSASCLVDHLVLSLKSLLDVVDPPVDLVLFFLGISNI